MDWRVKALVQGALARVPGGVRANDLLQRVFGERGDVSRHIGCKVRDDWLVHMANLEALSFPVAGRTLFEVGTGWLPVMPLCFALAGAERCVTVDTSPHLRPGAVRLVVAHLEPHLDAIADSAGARRSVIADRWRAWARADADGPILAAAGIEPRAPADATRTALPEASVDLVFSNSVLEHVPAPVVDAMMVEAARILRPGGLALHGVNCGDHYAYFDRRITPVHYLRYSEREWRRWNNALLFQNRLRPVDFVEAARRAGLEVVLDTHRPRPELLSRAAELPVAEEFRRYPLEQLLSTSVDFAARRPAAARPAAG